MELAMKSFPILVSDVFDSPTSSQTILNPAELIQDHILRIRSDSQSTYVNSWRTEDVERKFINVMLEKEKDISALKDVINWQKHTIDYHSVYTAMLLGAVDEDEFEKEAERFAVEYQQSDVEELAVRINRLRRLVDFEISPSDYAEIYRSLPECVDRAITFVEEKRKALDWKIKE